MNYKEFFKSKIFSGIIIGIGILIIVGIIFQAGKFVGLRKAEFSIKLGDNYNRIFGEQENDMMNFLPLKELPGGHGSVGKIVKIELPNIIVEDVGNVEKEIILTDDTTIRRSRNEIKPTDLKVGDSIAVLGNPNLNGQIEANLIRIMPSNSSVKNTKDNSTSTKK